MTTHNNDQQHQTVTIILNDQSLIVEHGLSINQLLKQQQLDCDYIAVAINHQFIAKQQYDDYQLQSNDIVDIVTPMQGG